MVVEESSEKFRALEVAADGIMLVDEVLEIGPASIGVGDGVIHREVD